MKTETPTWIRHLEAAARRREILVAQDHRGDGVGFLPLFPVPESWIDNPRAWGLGREKTTPPTRGWSMLGITARKSPRPPRLSLELATAEWGWEALEGHADKVCPALPTAPEAQHQPLCRLETLAWCARLGAAARILYDEDTEARPVVDMRVVPGGVIRAILAGSGSPRSFLHEKIRRPLKASLSWSSATGFVPSDPSAVVPRETFTWSPT